MTSESKGHIATNHEGLLYPCPDCQFKARRNPLFWNMSKLSIMDKKHSVDTNYNKKTNIRVSQCCFTWTDLSMVCGTVIAVGGTEDFTATLTSRGWLTLFNLLGTISADLHYISLKNL